MIHSYKPSEKLPSHNEQVLVRHGDNIDLAIFDAEAKTLKLRDGTTFKRDENVTWMKLLSDRVA